MAKTKPVEKQLGLPLMSWRDVGRLVLGGVLVGLITLALYAVLDKYILTPGLCSEVGTVTGRCENKLYFANAFAMVLGAFAGLFIMVQQRVFRPLLVVILATAGLWNIIMVTTDLSWWLHALIIAVLFGITYVAFAWLVQLRNFLVALILAVILVIAMRLVLMS